MLVLASYVWSSFLCSSPRWARCGAIAGWSGTLTCHLEGPKPLGSEEKAPKILTSFTLKRRPSALNFDVRQNVVSKRKRTICGEHSWVVSGTVRRQPSPYNSKISHGVFCNVFLWRQKGKTGRMKNYELKLVKNETSLVHVKSVLSLKNVSCKLVSINVDCVDFWRIIFSL